MLNFITNLVGATWLAAFIALWIVNRDPPSGGASPELVGDGQYELPLPDPERVPTRRDYSVYPVVRMAR